MNENSSKQVLLSVVGIAVLIIAVVGVSFAFFSYSRAGTTNNTLTTGSIFMQFTEGTGIRLTNQFPIADSTAANYAGSQGDNPTLTFHVIGWDGSGTGITYTVTATQGDAETGKTRFNDSGIKLYLDATGASGNSTNNYSSSTGTVVGANNSLSGGITLATGEITATTENAKQDDTYVLHMWISDALVSIDENEGSGDGDNVYNPTEFANLYYSLKVNVTANTTTS